jgi:hypothetical protein
MPDFDTSTRQEPVQPSKLKMFVAASKQHMSAVASKQHMSAVASRLRTSARVQLSNKNIIRLLGIGGGILLLAVVAVVTIVWAVLRHPQTPADQLDQELQPTPTPAYEVVDYNSGNFSSCSSGECSVTKVCPRGISNCNVVSTEANGARKLASITEDAARPYADGGQSLTFYDAALYNLGIFELDAPNATSYCFVDKDLAVSTLRGELDKAELLGKTDKCYVAVYEGSGPSLKTKPSWIVPDS